jgi:hypothetical protein
MMSGGVIFGLVVATVVVFSAIMFAVSDGSLLTASNPSMSTTGQGDRTNDKVGPQQPIPNPTPPAHP